jgi:enoyl-CoA hydratase
MGCILALNCDLRLMADGPVIGLPEASLGIVAALGGTQKLVRNVGPSRALQLMLEGELMTADEAADLGLVHRVLAVDELQAAARETAIRVSSLSPTATREIKRLVYDAGSRPLAAGLRQEAASAIATMSSPQATRSLITFRDALAAQDRLDAEAVLDIWRAHDWVTSNATRPAYRR